MFPFSKPGRKIIYDPFVERHVSQALDRFERLDEVILFLEWLLRKDPANEFARQIDDGPMWIIGTEGYPMLHGAPRVTLQYYFDDTSVTFWNIRIEPPR